MKQIIAQGTKEWQEQRTLRITGSRLGAILGLSPWQKPDDVLREMVRQHHGVDSEFVENPATQHGKHNEQRALLCFMRETGLSVEQCGFFPYGDRMGASPDGITSNGGALELKVPFGLRNGGEFKPLADQPHYYAQVQMEMLATGLKHAYFSQYIAPKGDPLSFDYVEEKINIERVEFDPNWIESVLPEINLFYQRLLNELDNPEHLLPLRVIVDTPTAGEMLAEIDTLRTRQKEDSAREKELLAALVVLCDGKDSIVHGRNLTLVERKGTVSYAKALEKYAPDADLEPFRGKDSSSWRLY